MDFGNVYNGLDGNVRRYTFERVNNNHTDFMYRKYFSMFWNLFRRIVSDKEQKRRKLVGGKPTMFGKKRGCGPPTVRGPGRPKKLQKRAVTVPATLASMFNTMVCLSLLMVYHMPIVCSPAQLPRGRETGPVVSSSSTNRIWKH